MRQQIQVQVNEAQQEQANLKRRAEQQVDTTRKPRKMCGCGDRTRDADDSEVNPQDTETRIRNAGRHFALMWCSRSRGAQLPHFFPSLISDSFSFTFPTSAGVKA
jgi:hypothetical protein